MKKCTDIINLTKSFNKFQNLNSKIKDYSLYDPILISRYIADLISLHEGVKYELEVANDMFGYRTIINTKEDPINHPMFKLYSFDERDNSFYNYYILDRPNTFLPPRGYFDGFDGVDIDYVHDFIDYLYENRSKENITEVNEEFLNRVYESYVNKNINKINKKKEEITSSISSKEKEDLEETCLIDENNIFKSIRYMVNNYEHDYFACETVEEDRKDTLTYNAVKKSHRLKIINREDGDTIDICVNYTKTAPKDMDINKCTAYISFYNVVKQIDGLLSKCPFLANFLIMIEELFQNNRKLTEDDIDSILSDFYNYDDIKVKENDSVKEELTKRLKF